MVVLINTIFLNHCVGDQIWVYIKVNPNLIHQNNKFNILISLWTLLEDGCVWKDSSILHIKNWSLLSNNSTTWQEVIVLFYLQLHIKQLTLLHCEGFNWEYYVIICRTYYRLSGYPMWMENMENWIFKEENQSWLISLFL